MASNATILRRVKREASKGRPPLRYRIQLVDKQLFNETISFMIRHFLPRENVNKAVGSILSEETIEERKIKYEKYLAEGISLAAFLEDENGQKGAMISCNVLYLDKEDAKKSDEITKCTEVGRKWLQLNKALKEAGENVFTLYKCSSYITCMGLTVAPEYEGLGIGTQMLQAREELCKLIDVPVSATIFTGNASQRIAAKVGYELLSELDLTTFQIDGQIVVPNPDWPTLKWMAIKYKI